MCCLKRPFDDQSQPRVRLEADAVLALLESPGTVEPVRAAALDLENSRNPVRARAERVQAWLDGLPLPELRGEVLEARVAALLGIGFAGFDALHVASAEAVGAEVLVTCDDRLLRASQRVANELRVRILDPLQLFSEVMP